MSAEGGAQPEQRTVYADPEDPFIGEVVVFHTDTGRVGGRVERAEEIAGDVRVHIKGREQPLVWSDVERPETQGSFVCSQCNAPSAVPYICDDCRGERE